MRQDLNYLYHLNDGICRYIFMFPQNYLACKELRLCEMMMQSDWSLLQLEQLNINESQATQYILYVYFCDKPRLQKGYIDQFLWS